MHNTISIKELRSGLSKIANKVEKGDSFIVFRRSKPCLKVVPITSDEDQQWETIADFTEGGKKKGIKIEEALAVLKKLN